MQHHSNNYSTYDDNNQYTSEGYQQISYNAVHPPSHYTQRKSHTLTPPRITALVYDGVKELLWTGSSNGWLASVYHGASHAIRTRFNINPHHTKHTATTVKPTHQSIIAICPHVKCITVVASGSILFCTRGGAIRHIHNVAHTIVAAIQPDFNTPTILYTTSDNALYTYDIITQTSTDMHVSSATPAQFSCLAAERTIMVCGRTDGYVETRDSRQQCKYTAMSKQAHPGCVTDVTFKDNTVVTCGYAQISTDRYTRNRHDSLVKVFDVRNKSMLAPVQLSNNSGCTRVQFVPTLSNTVVAMNMNGMFELIDLNANTMCNATAKHPYYSKLSDNSIIDSTSVSSSGQCVAFADSSGVVQEWSAHPTSVVNTYSTPIDYIQPVPTENLCGFTFDELTPLTYVQLPAVDTGSVTLLSDKTYWPNRDAYSLDPPIDTSLIADLKYNDYVGYAINPNPSLYKPNSAVTVQKFSVAYQMSNSLSSSANESAVDKQYARVTIKIPKLGLYAYDFSKYNQSPYTGLDNLLPNSYVNSALQVLYFVESIRHACMHHICFNEYCLTCELGLLYHMLQTSVKPNTIEPRNLLHTLKHLPECTALNLLDDSYSVDKLKLSSKIQDFIRFMLEQLHKERVSHTNDNTTTASDHGQSNGNIISQLFEANVMKQQQCASKQHKVASEATTFHTKLLYPKTRQSNSFGDILGASLCSSVTRRTKCQQCNAYELTQHTQYVTTLPHMLNISASITNDIQIDLWRTRGSDGQYWLPVYIRVTLDINLHSVHVEQLTSQPNTDDERVVSAAVYKLYSVISHIVDPKSTNSALHQHNGEHLVAHINTHDDVWYCFNDFVINVSDANEATNFAYPYKLPSQVLYKRIDTNAQLTHVAQSHDTAVKSVYHDLIYTKFESLSPSTDHSKLRFTPLTPDEVLDSSTLVAIDCEFVAVQHAITENTIVVRPARLALARVSIIRASGDRVGQPFIDDYVVETEPIVDYLSQYSGIHAGDLDAHNSLHHLQTLKQVSIKLRSLVDRGVKFIGHGLKSDFLMINVYVPAEQIIDTVELYYIESQRRRLSLRWLAANVLQLAVQQDEHDSIQDANTARLLYEKYAEWQAEGGKELIETKLKDLYSKGNVSGFKV